MSVRVSHKALKCIIPTRGKNLRIDSFEFAEGFEFRDKIEVYYRLEPLIGPIRKSRQLLYDSNVIKGNSIILNHHVIMGSDVQKMHIKLKLLKPDLKFDMLIKYSFPEPRKTEEVSFIVS